LSRLAARPRHRRGHAQQSPELLLQRLHPLLRGPGRGRELGPQRSPQPVQLGRDAVLDVHPMQHRIAADQARRADQHDAHGDEDDREPDRAVAAAEQHHNGRDRGEPEAGPDESAEQPRVLRRRVIAVVRHGRRCYRFRSSEQVVRRRKQYWGFRRRARKRDADAGHPAAKVILRLVRRPS
jgi:hypothetical protein